MRTQKTALRKINEWKSNSMLVAGIYRLFTYISWDKIPGEYKTFFPEVAKDTWDDDLKNYDTKNMFLDIEAEIKAILQVLARKNVTHCLGLVPIILADAYMLGISVNKFQSSLIKIVNNYKNYVDVDRALAEQYSIIGVVDLLKEIATAIKIDLSFDIDNVLQKLLDDYNKNVDASVRLLANQNSKPSIDYDAVIAEAEAKEAAILKAKQDEKSG